MEFLKKMFSKIFLTILPIVFEQATRIFLVIFRNRQYLNVSPSRFFLHQQYLGSCFPAIPKRSSPRVNCKKSERHMFRKRVALIPPRSALHRLLSSQANWSDIIDAKHIFASNFTIPQHKAVCFGGEMGGSKLLNATGDFPEAINPPNSLKRGSPLGL